MSSAGEHYLERELRELVKSDESIFDFLQSGSLDGIWYWDLENPDNEWMSQKFWRVFGYDPSEKKHLAAEWQDMIDPSDLNVALDNFHKHCSDPDHPYDQVVRYTHKNGSTVWVRCRGLAIRDENGKPRRMLGAHTDITALKHAEESLRSALSANYELEQFAYIASHDLREPLRTVVNYLELLNRKFGTELPEEARTYLDVASDSAKRTQDLISGLHRYARVGTSRERQNDVDTTELARRALASLKSMVNEGSADVEIESLPRLDVDSQQIEQVFQNLFANAMKYRGQEPPRIHVGASRKGDYWEFFVQDNGIGIAPASQERIFQMFQRLHPPGEFEGDGVGLALARRIVQQHGGRIWVESDGSGSCFRFTLPAETSRSLFERAESESGASVEANEASPVNARG